MLGTVIAFSVAYSRGFVGASVELSVYGFLIADYSFQGLVWYRGVARAAVNVGARAARLATLLFVHKGDVSLPDERVLSQCRFNGGVSKVMNNHEASSVLPVPKLAGSIGAPLSFPCSRTEETKYAILPNGGLNAVTAYPGRSSYGSPEYKCPHCHALFWFQERVKSESQISSGKIVYNSCCKVGRVKIPAFLPRPEPLASLATFSGGPRSKSFMKHIREYNCLFAFTSMGANIDRSINDGRGPPVFKISGQVHHRIGSLLPADGSPPKFIQLYIYDTAHEVSNSLTAIGSVDRPCDALAQKNVEALAQMLDQHNPFAKKFRLAKDRLADHEDENFVVRIVGAGKGDPVQYNLPTTDQLAMLVVGDFTLDTFKRDIVIEARSGRLQQISSLHPAYMALQYPLLFPYGERGFQVGVLYEGHASTSPNARTKMTEQDYYRCLFHYKPDQPNPYLCYGSLSAQAKVDARACIDESRLWYIIDNQKKLRSESIQGIADAIGRGYIDGGEMGKHTVLPASHTGGRRYMIQNYHDGIAICRVYGPPDFFTTFTCNAKWLEIAESIASHPGQKPSDKADMIVRVYNMKLEELMEDVRGGTAFGPVAAVLHTVEFQKRGLPHAHIIIWLLQDTSQPTPDFINRFISAEIPDPNEDPLGYALVAEHMMHGPCGPTFPRCPCMKKGRCSKGYPKPFQEITTITEDGFAVYKRPDNSRFVEKGGACSYEDVRTYRGK
ncbi:hypothetical protein U9M48_039647, partial [Paspalum notatum var. saurae]